MKKKNRKALEKKVAWFFFIFGGLGLVINTTTWLLGIISDRTMLGITLALSWLAILVPGFNAIVLNEDSE